MAGLSQEDRNIINNHRLTNLVDRLQGALQDAEKIYESRPIYDESLYRNAISKLLYTLQGEDAAYNLPSRINDGDVASDLAQLFERLRKAKENFRYDDYRPLVNLVIQRPPTESENDETWNFDVWKAVFTLIDTIPRSTPPASVPPSFDGTPVKSTSSSQKGSEQTRELVDPRIFEEIRSCTFRDVQGFFDKYFEKKDWSSKADAVCQRVLAPGSDGNWAQFPNPPTQSAVLAWWFRLQEDLLTESRGIYYTTASKADLTGSKAERQVDLLLRASGANSSQNKHDWRDILTKGILPQMSRYVREVFVAQATRRFVHAFAVCGTKMEAWVFDHSGPYSSGIIDVHADSRRFFQLLVGYTMMSDEELGLDTFVAKDEDGNKSITVKWPGNSEGKNVRLGEILSFQRAIVCRGTTCFLANDGQVEGVAKFSWVSDKRRPEAELLELAGRKSVQGVARIIGHSTITSIADMRYGLTFDNKRHNFKSAPPSTASSFHQSQPLTELRSLGISRKSSSRKRRSPDKGMQVSKRSRSIDQLSRDTQQENELAFSIQSAHKPSLFVRITTGAVQGVSRCNKAHRSLYLDGNILHRDISENNIVITNPDNADGYSGMLIDLDLAKEVGSGRSGARHQTGTMEFMAIEVLLNIDHTYRHDLESFFYVLIWQCARHGWDKLKELRALYQSSGSGWSGDTKLEIWFAGSLEEIARIKRSDMRADGFEDILSEFPPIFECAKPLCRAIRDILFPYGGRGITVGTPQDPCLYNPIIEAYDEAISLIECQSD
ncbi:hypothetical protein ACJ73_08693 [Blastomyces percursus]|uniref:EKC/KEOPS complex subunit BUD32 n=1 Tax=Blastomyces percursus TaxID=1658174 RepID=A0A1J9PRA6_9EURO|nr:hypothetical protein ACJ73_08693 [Blastomyces percursus]